MDKMIVNMTVKLETRFISVNFGPFYKTLKTFPIDHKIPEISCNDIKQRKKSFNYLLTHDIIPQLMFSDLNNFYENWMERSADMELFINIAISHATKIAGECSNICESPFELEKLKALWIDTHTVGEVVIITIPNAKKQCDCIQIAFVAKGNDFPQYFTLELAENQKLLLCGWTLKYDILCHVNYLMVIKQKNFFKKIVEILKRNGFWLRNGSWKPRKNKNCYCVITPLRPLR
jgi:hypothetical protein